MKITEVKTAEVRVKIDDKRGYLYHYVRIYTDEGVYGTGEASHVDGGWRGSTRSMAEQVIGKDPRDVAAIVTASPPILSLFRLRAGGPEPPYVAAPRFVGLLRHVRRSSTHWGRWSSRGCRRALGLGAPRRAAVPAASLPSLGVYLSCCGFRFAHPALYIMPIS